MTLIEIAEEMYKNITVSPLKLSADAASGSVYLFQREVDARGEDIVINVLPVVQNPIQRCIVNVNVYCPNLSIPLGNNKYDNTRPDGARLAQLAELATASLTDVSHFSGQYEYTIQQQQIYANDENNEHYLNFRIEFFSQLTL